jgi:fructose-1,6-bisphosphatase/inositol monophosphatase family enzyme
VIVDPVRREEFTASRGKGAQLNGHRIRVSKLTSLNGALLGTGIPFMGHWTTSCRPTASPLRASPDSVRVYAAPAPPPWISPT